MARIKFIATLSSEDSADWTPALENVPPWSPPVGEHLAFVSQAPLTGYDNIDVGTGSPDTEVFVYDASTGRLSCASCNPSGARPVGPATVPTGKDIDHTPRSISDDGRRVFFDSEDALLPSDTNGSQNVYEYENGSIYLISPGGSEDISSFADASANGDNVFFTTRARLVPGGQGRQLGPVRCAGRWRIPACCITAATVRRRKCRGPFERAARLRSALPPKRARPRRKPSRAIPRPAPTPKSRSHKSRIKIKGRKSKSKRSARKSTSATGVAAVGAGDLPGHRHRRGGHTS